MSRPIERLYFSSPIWLQQLLVAAFGFKWYHRRFSAHFHQQVSDFKAREHWTLEQFQNYQQRRLKQLGEAAWASTYYRRIFLEAGISSQMMSLETLTHLPLLSKETLRARPEDLLTKKHCPRGTTVFKSSGTTGTPTAIYYTPEFHAIGMAVAESRNLNWAGVTHKDRRVMFGVRKVCEFTQNRPPFWRFSPVENMAYASIYHLSPRHLPAYVDFLRQYKPSVIMGYPSALYTLARYALDHDDLPAPARAVLPTSETVLPHMRTAIETAWRSRVYDRYGAVEGCVFASQCEYGRYHASPEIGIIEIIDSQGNPVQPGVLGEVICTGLQNLLQPLIRYRIGDVGRWTVEQSCPCGRYLPILEGIEGRFEDLCYTSDGRQMMRFDTVFKGLTHVKEAQVVQEKLAHFTVRVVPASGWNAPDIETIQRNMRLHVGEVRTDVKIVDKIPRTPAGKFRAVICNLSEEERRQISQVHELGSQKGTSTYKQTSIACAHYPKYRGFRA